MGSVHDSNAAQYNKHFKNILGKRFALGDPGYNGVPYVVAGSKASQLKTGHKKFDSISRTEQIPIEHVNNFIKKFSILSKQSKCIHTSSNNLSALALSN